MPQTTFIQDSRNCALSDSQNLYPSPLPLCSQSASLKTWQNHNQVWQDSGDTYQKYSLNIYDLINISHSVYPITFISKILYFYILKKLILHFFYIFIIFPCVFIYSLRICQDIKEKSFSFFIYHRHPNQTEASFSTRHLLCDWKKLHSKWLQPALQPPRQDIILVCSQGFPWAEFKRN